MVKSGKLELLQVRLSMACDSLSILDGNCAAWRYVILDLDLLWMCFVLLASHL